MCVCVHVCVCAVCAQVCTVHSCTCNDLIHAHATICETSVRNKNPKSLQVVQAQSVCMYVCVHVCMCTGVYIHAHVRLVKTV